MSKCDFKKVVSPQNLKIQIILEDRQKDCSKCEQIILNRL